MADEILRSKHAFGASQNLESAISDGKIDAYDILFLDGDTDQPKIGWLDKNGNVVLVKDEKADLTELEAELATKADAEEVEAKIAEKADAEEVNAKIDQVASEVITDAKAYTDGKVEAAVNEHLVKKYEVSNTPNGTLVNYGEKEIRIMCPANAQWEKQNVGEGGDANNYYLTFKTYVFDENVVGYIEHLGDQVDSEILTDLSVDEYGRRYQPTWLAMAKYDESTDTWTYYGAKSTVDKYIGWDYQIDWYDADGVMIASDCVRINLSNEECHSEIKPYYVNGTLSTANAYTDEQINALLNSMAIVEF